MSFIKYQHLERYGTTEVDGIEVGTCYVFPKLDGTNGSVWVDGDRAVDCIRCGSRNRELELDNDNAGFMNAMYQDKAMTSFMYNAKDLVLYGEWLVPHTLKTYRDDAWCKFYIFDVYDRTKERLLSYDEYSAPLLAAGLNVIAPIAIIKNGNEAHFTECLSKAHYLVKDGEGSGEGVVVKNYDYKNRSDRQTWAKIVANEFKAKHHLEMGVPVIGCEIVEEKIVDKFVTQAMIDKVVAKITNDNDGWSSKNIPQLINTVFYDLVKEETWEFVKAHKNPTINFKTLSHYTTAKVKELRKDIF
jgi:hypothetical protein